MEHHRHVQLGAGRGKTLELNSDPGSDNVAAGLDSLLYNTTGSFNAAVGYGALLNNTSATSSVALGYLAGSGVAAYSNQGGTYLGFAAGDGATTGSDYNTFVGYEAGMGVTTGAHNIIVGADSAGTSNLLTTGSNNILIGYEVSATSSTAANSLNIGNLLFNRHGA